MRLKRFEVHAAILLIIFLIAVLVWKIPAHRSPVEAFAITLCVIFLILILWLLRAYYRMQKFIESNAVALLRNIAQDESRSVPDVVRYAARQIKAREEELEQLHSAQQEWVEVIEGFSSKIIASIPGGLVAVNPQGEVILANDQALEIFSVPSPLDINESHKDYRTLFKDVPEIIEMVDECLRDSRTFFNQEFDVNLSSKGKRRLSASVSPLGRGYQDAQGALCLVSDVTEVHHLREQIRIKENLASLGVMSAGIAHEFKNSIATIRGYTQLLQGDLGQVNSKETTAALLEEANHLTNMVTDFLDFARPQAIKHLPVDLESLLSSCIEELKTATERARVAVEMEGEFEPLMGDPMLLRSAFLNLIRNAIESIPEDADRRTVKLRGSASTNSSGRRYINVDVADTGSGIPEDAVDKVFIPFYTTKSRGYGIGLALVQKIINGHGGSVTIESNTGGTTFHCSLPAGER